MCCVAPYTVYTFRVVASTSVGIGLTFSDPVIFETSERGKNYGRYPNNTNSVIETLKIFKS